MAARASLLAALSAVVVLSTSCGVTIDPHRAGFPCDPGGHCASGLVCVNGTCDTPGAPDGGADGGATDAGSSDGGVPNESVSATIGYAGGALVLPGASVTFPEGALGTPTHLTLTRLSTAPPAGDGPMSPMYAIAPAGMTLFRPATVTLAFQGSAGDASGYWKGTSSAGMERVGADLVDSTGAHFGIVRLGEGFVGSIAAHPTFTFYGVASTAWVGQDGTVVEPQSLAGGTISAVLANGTTLQGSGATDGILRIPGVPEGTHAVLIETYGSEPAIGVVTRRHVLDESRVIPGRPWDAVPVASPNTSFEPTYTGLRSLSTTTWVNGFSPDVRLALSTLSAPPNVTTASDSHPYDVVGVLPGGGGHADRLWAWQSEPGLDGAFGNTNATVAMGSTPFTLTDGASNGITVPMSTTQPNRRFSATLALGAAQGVFGKVPGSPGGAQTDLLLRVSPIPVGIADSYLATSQVTGSRSALVGGSAQLVSATASATAGNGGPLKLSVPYVDILPSAWSRFWALEINVITSLGSANNGTTVPLFSETQGEGDAPAATVAPAISAPTGIAIDGLSATNPGLSGVGTTPTVTWAAPSTGTAAGYLVTLLRHGTYDAPVLLLLVAGSPVTIPPGYLKAGSYRLEVTAIAPDLSGHSANLTGSPYRAVPWAAGLTQATTEYFSP